MKIIHFKLFLISIFGFFALTGCTNNQNNMETSNQFRPDGYYSGESKKSNQDLLVKAINKLISKSVANGTKINELELAYAEMSKKISGVSVLVKNNMTSSNSVLASNNTTREVSKKQFRVIANLKLRASNNLSSKQIGSVRKNEIINAKYISNNMAYIESKKGFVSIDYLRPVSEKATVDILTSERIAKIEKQLSSLFNPVKGN